MNVPLTFVCAEASATFIITFCLHSVLQLVQQCITAKPVTTTIQILHLLQCFSNIITHGPTPFFVQIFFQNLLFIWQG